MTAHPIALAFLALVPALAGCADGPAAPTSSASPFERVTFLTVPAADGHRVPVTVYRPEGSSASDPVPVVLQSHGWGGRRETRLEAYREFTDAGLAVVSIDMRGHGEATGTSQARVANPEYETRDAIAVADYLSGLDWVARDGADGEGAADPLLGAMGESYGGAFALLLAAFDPRVDAVVAENTWHDLEGAMAPNGVPKTAWFAGLWLSASIQGRIHPEVRAGFEEAVRNGTIPDGSKPGITDLRSLMRASSPGTYAATLAVPTLFLQGGNDTLFDLGQAFANRAMVQANGAPTALVTHLGGHTLEGGSRLPAAMRHPCGDPGDLALAWFRLHLLGAGDGVDAVCVTLDDGSVQRSIEAPAPPGDTLALPPLQAHPGNLSHRSHAGTGLAGPASLVGWPRLEGTAPAGATGTVYWSLEVVGDDGRARTANRQVMPHRLQPGAFAFDLAPVAIHLGEGESLRLAVASHDPLYAAAPRALPSVQLDGLRLALPVACTC